MRIVASTSPGRARLAFWALAALALLASHDAIFLVQDGPGDALVRALRSGDHAYWGLASLLLIGVAIVAGVATVRRVIRLRRRAADLRAVPTSSHLVRRVVTVSSALFAVVCIGFFFQENVEHFVAHGHVIGVGALVGPEYPLAIPVIGLISLITGFAGALLGGTEASLREAIAVALAGLNRRPLRRLRLAPASDPPCPQSVLARQGAGRAPPEMLATV